MSLETEIFAAVKGLFPATGGAFRLYPLTFPQSPTIPEVPACRYVFISNEPVEDICGTDGDATSNTRTQLDILGKTFAEARALRLQVISAMSGLATPTRLAGSFDDYDAELKLYRCSVDFISYPSS